MKNIYNSRLSRYVYVSYMYIPAYSVCMGIQSFVVMRVAITEKLQASVISRVCLFGD